MAYDIGLGQFRHIREIILAQETLIKQLINRLLRDIEVRQFIGTRTFPRPFKKQVFVLADMRANFLNPVGHSCSLTVNEIYCLSAATNSSICARVCCSVKQTS